jgi:hypothetical protein
VLVVVAVVQNPVLLQVQLALAEVVLLEMEMVGQLTVLLIQAVAVVVKDKMVAMVVLEVLE